MGETKPTIGIDFSIVDKIIDNKHTVFHFWDTAGQEKFRGMTSSYYKNCHGLFLVFDITNRSTLDRLNKWIAEKDTLCDSDVILVLIGNKSDLENERKVMVEEAETFSKDHNMKYFEISAKTNLNDCVDHAFEYMIDEVYKSGSGEQNYAKMSTAIHMRMETEERLKRKTTKGKVENNGCC